MKYSLLAPLFLGLSASLSAQLITLKPVGYPQVSIPFSIEVWVDNSIVPAGSELLSFAFDVDTSPNLSLLSTTVGGDFLDDVGLTPFDVAGTAFPGVPDPNVLLASIELVGLAPGPAFFLVEAPVDIVGGLKYIDPINPALPAVPMDYPIEARYMFEVSIVPEPTFAALLGIAMLVGLVAVRRR